MRKFLGFSLTKDDNFTRLTPGVRTTPSFILHFSLQEPNKLLGHTEFTTETFGVLLPLLPYLVEFNDFRQTCLQMTMNKKKEFAFHAPGAAAAAAR